MIQLTLTLLARFAASSAAEIETDVFLFVDHDILHFRWRHIHQGPCSRDARTLSQYTGPEDLDAGPI